MVQDQKSTRYDILFCLYFGFLNMTVWITMEYDCFQKTKKYEPESQEATDKLLQPKTIMKFPPCFMALFFVYLWIISDLAYITNLVD